MKVVLFLFAFINSINVYGQFGEYIGTWVSKQRDCLVIRDSTNKYSKSNMLCTDSRDEGMSLFIYGDTLSFQNRYYSSETNFKKLYVNRYDLKISKFDGRTLAVMPASQFAKDRFQGRDTINFIRQGLNVDSSIKFSKIIYHTGSCFGACPSYHLQIDSSGAVKLHAQTIYLKNSTYLLDSLAQGYFTGKISETNLSKLINAIQTCDLRTLSTDSILCCDAPVTTIIVYFNGQRKYVKTMFPPMIIAELIKTLYAISEGGGLKKTNEKFTIEQ